MTLPNELASQFAKVTNDSKKQTEETVYGTVISKGDKLYVNIDGSDSITPIVTTAEIKAGERVAVMIKGHTATVIGNITNPGASKETTDNIVGEFDVVISKIGDFELVVADKVSSDQLEAKLAIVDELLADKATISELNAVKASIEDLDVKELEADVANIHKAMIDKAEIKDLDAIHADIDILESDFADIETLVGGNLTMDNMQSLILTSSKVTVDNAFIKDAMIDRVSASKLTAGTINTNMIQIASDDGSMAINGSLQQFKDANGNVRIQIGKDANDDFTFVLYGEDGTGQLINQNGITASAIGDGLIVNDMVADNAQISGDKLDISSVITEINDSSTNIKSSSIVFDDTGQSLSVAFNNLEDTVQNIKDESQGDFTSLINRMETLTTELDVQQGEINTLVSNTTIVTQGGQTISMKDDYTSTKQTVNSISSKVSSLETTASNISSKQSQLETNLNGITSRVSNVETKQTTNNDNIASLTTRINTAESKITDSAIINTVSSTIDSKINNVKIGSTNLFKGFTKDKEYTLPTYGNEGSFVQYTNNLTIDPANYLGDSFTISFYAKSPNGTTPLQLYNKNSNPRYFYFNTTLDSALGSSWKYYSYTFVNNDRGSSYSVSNKIEIYAPNQMGVVIKNLKVERGNKATDWTPAPEDIQTQIDTNASQLSTTNSKVSSLETSLNDITSRVSNVETKQTTANNNISSLTTRVNTAESKITDSAIVSTVTNSTTYKNNLDGKVSTNSVISTINQTAESIKINANKVNLSGYTTFTNLSTSGQTTINADNITTGKITAITLEGVSIDGKSMIYIREGGTLSCDGNTIVKDFYIPETHPGWGQGEVGSFHVEPTARFEHEVWSGGEMFSAGLGVVQRQDGVYIQIKSIGMQKQNNAIFMLIICYNNSNVYGVDVWNSDESLKENIINLKEKNDSVNPRMRSVNANKIGLDLVNSINHYSFNYNEEKGFGNESVDCGYIAQDLQSLNPSLVREVPQQDGKILLEPRASMIIPHLSKAIQEQSEIIKKLESRILEIEKFINNDNK